MLSNIHPGHLLLQSFIPTTRITRTAILLLRSVFTSAGHVTDYSLRIPHGIISRSPAFIALNVFNLFCSLDSAFFIRNLKSIFG
jgi:hypothetical protein